MSPSSSSSASRLPPGDRSPPVDPAALLAALDIRVVAVDAGGRVLYTNVGGTVNAPPLAPRDPLRAAFPALATAVEALIRGTAQDGRERSVQVVDPAPSLGGLYDARVRPLPDGVTLVELRPVELQRGGGARRVRDDDSLRMLARQVSEISDTHALLRILADAARSQCDGDGVAVVRTDGGVGHVLVALGSAAEHGAVRFDLSGSLAERVVATRQPAASACYPDEQPRYAEEALRMGVGPVLVAPLIAHGSVFGVVAVQRRRGGPPFGSAESEQLRIVADHLALVFWQSRLFEHVRLANEVKSNFLATISHELRTPLTALTGYGELLADEILGPMAPAQLEVVERMRSVTHHLTAMIDEILTYSSLEAGRETVRTLPADARETAEAAAAVVEPLARQKGIAFRLDIQDDIPAIVTDPDKVRQILVNLFGNAVKFTEQGSVLVTVRVAGDRVRFDVRDTGIGIAGDNFARLFQPFSQLESGLTRRHGGTGLGLYIAHRLAALLEGELVVESAPGCGSTFTLHLPIRRA